MATAVYLRQSRDRDGNELAVSRQREDCLRLCADRGWSDVVEYVDNNVSASNRRVTRPAYGQMLADIAAGRIDGVVVWDCDRLYRQPRELEDFIDLADARRLRLATVTGDVDLSTDNGRLFARIKGAVAKAEGERKAARWKRSNEQGAAAGKWTATHRPFGYTITGEPLEPEASLLAAAYGDVLTMGKSLRRIATEWNAQGVPTVRGAAWTNNRIRRMLLNPRYAALRVLRGEVVGKGTWTAIVDEDTWRGVGALLRDPDRVVCTTFAVAHMGVGVYRCGRDGCRETMKTHYDKHKVRGYTCSATPHLVRRGDPLDDLVTAWVLERMSQPDAADVLMDPQVGGDGADLEARRDALVHRKGELRSLFREGLLDSDELRRDLAVVVDKINHLDRQIVAAAVRTSPAASLAAATSDAELMARWKAMPPATRGRAVDEVATVTVLPCPRGLRRFDPTYVRLRWRRDEDGGSQGTTFVDM